MTTSKFSTAEKFLMLAHHPEKGRFITSHLYIQHGIAGALLLDMTLDDRIEMAEKKLLLKAGKETAESVTGEITSLLSGSAKPRKAEYWIRKLAGRYNKYKWQILKGLEGKRVVRIENRKFLWVIPYRKSYLIESYTRSNIISQLKNDILFHKALEGENLALAGLIQACRMHRILTHDREELKEIRRRLKQIIKESPVADLVGQTIRQVQAAIMVSVTAGIVASTAGSRH
ncbi:MAG: GPP34 family phosphoprotein [Bacteroidales bacterium]|jgi:hypothetical protein|nr:GPP34 family phosphoprotein [Bacteroidales bacterium]